MRSMVLFLLVLLLMRSPAVSLGFTILGENFYVCDHFFLSNHESSHIPSSCMVHAGYIFDASIQPSRI